MTLLVVDASVVLKWFVPEEQSDDAVRLLDGDMEFLAPDLLFAETANAVWKKARRGEIGTAAAQRLVEDLVTLPIDAVPARALAADAHALARRVDVTVYDAMYLALAVRARTRLVTADRRLHQAAVQFRGLSGHVKLLGSRMT